MITLQLFGFCRVSYDYAVPILAMFVANPFRVVVGKCSLGD